MADDEVAHHYAALAEATRLTRSAHGRLEFLRTQELIRRLAPAPPARVLDVGGATGVHAQWLAQDGYQVHVVDPIAHHIEAVGALAGVTAEVGDARDLSAATGSVDAVLLLGPLYHLADARDRHVALDECRRVLRPGGVVFAAAISRYLSLLEAGTTGWLSAELVGSVTEVITTGTYDGHAGFVAGHWHTADELRDEVGAAGFSDVQVYGIEGPSWPALDAVDEPSSAGQDAALWCARLVEQDPLLVHASAHLLATAVA
jgi:2-polyprenyl-3-methyl-5-hydroxy-6-metoxy-1,4-benzoquinol methylase